MVLSEEATYHNKIKILARGKGKKRREEKRSKGKRSV